MKVKILILALGLLCFISCNSKNTQDHPNGNEELVRGNVADSNAQRLNNFKDTIIEVIYNDEFIMKVLESDLTLQNIKRIYSKEAQEKLVINKYDLQKKDTLMILIEGKDSIGFYKGQGNSLPHKMVVFSEKLTIGGNIHTGVEKDLFKNKFNVQSLSDTLRIQDIEGGNIITFYFRDNKLFQFIYKAEYLD
ncbi:MAG: hypothetical protein ACT4ON_04460 [Bacteroidota bacterium]